MKLRIIVEEDGSERLQFSNPGPYGDNWEDVPKVPVAEEWDFTNPETGLNKPK